MSTLQHNSPGTTQSELKSTAAKIRSRLQESIFDFPSSCFPPSPSHEYSANRADASTWPLSGSFGGGRNVSAFTDTKTSVESHVTRAEAMLYDKAFSSMMHSRQSSRQRPSLRTFSVAASRRYAALQLSDVGLGIGSKKFF